MQLAEVYNILDFRQAISHYDVVSTLYETAVLCVVCCVLCVVRRASCVVRRASCVVRRASCVVRCALCVVRCASCRASCVVCWSHLVPVALVLRLQTPAQEDREEMLQPLLRNEL